MAGAAPDCTILRDSPRVYCEDARKPARRYTASGKRVWRASVLRFRASRHETPCGFAGRILVF